MKDKTTTQTQQTEAFFTRIEAAQKAGFAEMEAAVDRSASLMKTALATSATAMETWQKWGQDAAEQYVEAVSAGVERISGTSK